MYVQLIKKHNWFINILKFKLGLGEKNRNQVEVEGWVDNMFCFISLNLRAKLEF